jgi:hypothetical protein
MKHPPPLVPLREATDAELPRTARALLKAAEAAGWRVRATYAHGYSLGLHDEPGPLVESIATRLRKPPLAAVAVWHNSKFSTAYVWTQYTNGRPIGARALLAFVKAAA